MSAHLEHRDSGYPVIRNLQLPGVSAHELSVFIDPDLRICPHSGSIFQGMILHPELHQRRDDRDDSVPKTFGKGIAAAVRAESRGRLPAGAQDNLIRTYPVRPVSACLYLICFYCICLSSACLFLVCLNTIRLNPLCLCSARMHR